jgi:hypothetical protein
MSVSSVKTFEEKREEAVKLFASLFHEPNPFPVWGDETARQVCIGAEKLLEYINTGKLPEPEKPSKD